MSANIVHQYIYVAGKFNTEEKERVRSLMTRLKGHGHHITYDWTDPETAATSSKEPGRRLDNDLRLIAEQEVEGVATCQTFVLLCHPDSKGAYTELGIAVALGKTIITVGDDKVTNIFLHLPRIFKAADDQHVVQLIISFTNYSLPRPPLFT